MTEQKTLSEEQISELEDQILDVDTVIQDPELLDPTIEFITLIDQKIQEMLPSINEHTSEQHIKRLQLCAYTLSKLAEEAESQLEEVKQEILKIKKNKNVSDAYQNNK